MRMKQSRAPGVFYPAWRRICLRPLAVRLSGTAPRSVAIAAAAWETATTLKEEEFARAIAPALFDYLRKSRSRGFVVSLSGGADSSAVTRLVALMAELAVQELGLAGVLERLAYLPLIQVTDAKALVQSLLSCVYQSTENSSQVTRDAADAVATAVGAEFMEWSVDNLVKDYVALLERRSAVN